MPRSKKVDKKEEEVPYVGFTGDKYIEMVNKKLANMKKPDRSIIQRNKAYTTNYNHFSQSDRERFHATYECNHERAKNVRAAIEVLKKKQIRC